MGIDKIKVFRINTMLHSKPLKINELQFNFFPMPKLSSRRFWFGSNNGSHFRETNPEKKQLKNRSAQKHNST